MTKLRYKKGIKVKKFITELLDHDMDHKVALQIKGSFTDNHGEEVDGLIFYIDDVEQFGDMVLLNFTDWRMNNEQTAQ